MQNFVRNSTTKRKLDWEQEEEMRSNKKKGEQRKLQRATKAECKWGETDDE